MQPDLRNPYLHVTPEIADALSSSLPVVALESTIISHGMPYPRNVETALAAEQTVRDQGALPATIAILNGKLRVGLAPDEIDKLGRQGTEATKTSRRDIALVIANNEDGATTVAATLIIASMAGISTFATGGIGGVHRGVEETLDISADLDELARTNIAVVCSGVKSVLDIPRTLEYLETRGVPVAGYKTSSMPAFYTRDSGYWLDHRFDSPGQVAAAMHAKWNIGLEGGVIVANPVPAEYALNETEIATVIDRAVDEMNRRGIAGKQTTPFLLAEIAAHTAGRSLDTNIQLLLNNARLAARIAVAYAGPEGRLDSVPSAE